MKREEVYKLIDGERDYQDNRWNDDSETRDGKSDILDRDKSIADWLIYMEYHLAKAKNSVYHLDPHQALAQIRKVTALGVCCMEYNDCPSR